MLNNLRIKFSSMMKDLLYEVSLLGGAHLIYEFVVHVL